jgi:hypothetical protein
MKTVVYDPLPEADNMNPVSMPSIGKSFSIGEEVVLTDEDAAIALTNPHFRLADAPPTKAAVAAPAAAKPADVPNSQNVSVSPQTVSTSPLNSGAAEK